jgi:hypothetical protein
LSVERGLHLAPTVDESVELARVLRVHAERALGGGNVFEPKVGLSPSRWCMRMDARSRTTCEP